MRWNPVFFYCSALAPGTFLLGINYGSGSDAWSFQVFLGLFEITMMRKILPKAEDGRS